MTIYERIDNAYKEVAEHEFKKDKWVGKWVVTRDPDTGKKVKTPDLNSDGYWVISITQILDVIQKVHARNGIKCIFEGPYYNIQDNEKRVTVPWRDTKRVIATGHYEVRIIGEGPDDMIETRAQCEAWDTEANDKLNNKLLTNAMRSLYRSLYAIDGDDTKDPEEENPTVTDSEPAQQDPFFSKKEPTTEADVTKAENTERTAAWAEKKADELRPDLIQFYQQNPQCSIVAERIKDHGQISDWRPDIVIQVHGDLKKEGLL